MKFILLPYVFPAFGALAVPGNFGAPAVPCLHATCAKILYVLLCCQVMWHVPPPPNKAPPATSPLGVVAASIGAAKVQLMPHAVSYVSYTVLL